MDKEQILLVGWCNSTNYGTNLQAIALYNVLNRYGKCNLFWDRRYYTAAIFLEKAYGKIKSILKKETQNIIPKDNVKISNIRSCFGECNKVTINSKSELVKVIEKYSTYVIGSDQVWNPFYLNDTFLLDFVPKDKNKISYAASIGVSSIPKRYHSKYKKYLGDFSYISMREKSGAEYMGQILGREIDTVLDPTLLLTKEEWSEYCKGDDNIVKLPQEFILCYFVGDKISHWDKVQAISKETALPIIILPMNAWDLNVPGATLLSQAGPKEFVRVLEKATVVCTDSFHMCAFSINFDKHLIAFKRFCDSDSSGQNSRIDDLFEMVGINRYYRDGILDEPENFQMCDGRLSQERQRCLKLLKAHLLNCCRRQ